MTSSSGGRSGGTLGFGGPTRVVVGLGGSFNPVHSGHIAIVDQAIAELREMDGVTVTGAVLAVARESWVRGKLPPHEVIKAKHRLAMVNSATAAAWGHLDITVPVQKECYSSALEAARVQMPDRFDCFVDVRGSDHVGKAGSWKWRQPANHHRIVFVRGAEGAAILEAWREDCDAGLVASPDKWLVRPSDGVGDLSSTNVRRAMVEQGLNTALYEEAMPPGAAEHIRRHFYDLFIAHPPPLPTLPPPGALPFQLPYVYLSEHQRQQCSRHPALEQYVEALPAWVPQTAVAAALGFGHEGMINAMAALGGQPYLWATEFENVHAVWRYREPAITIQGVRYNSSEEYYHAQKPQPYSDEAWFPRRVEVMRAGVEEKFKADGGARALLLSTRGFPLLSIKRDRFWGFDAAKGGENMLARLLVEIRDGTPAAEPSRVPVSDQAAGGPQGPGGAGRAAFLSDIESLNKVA